jgi:hypothetical protein
MMHEAPGKVRRQPVQRAPTSGQRAFEIMKIASAKADK